LPTMASAASGAPSRTGSVGMADLTSTSSNRSLQLEPPIPPSRGWCHSL
jgi:hypothetical protein